MAILSHLKLPEHQYVPSVTDVDPSMISAAANNITRRHEQGMAGMMNLSESIAKAKANANEFERAGIDEVFRESMGPLMQNVEAGDYGALTSELPKIAMNLSNKLLPYQDSIVNRNRALEQVRSHATMPPKLKEVLLEEYQSTPGLFSEVAIPTKFLGDEDIVEWSNQIKADVTTEISPDGTKREIRKELTPEELTSRLIPILSEPGSDFFEQEKFIAEAEARRSPDGMIEYRDDYGNIQRTNDINAVARMRVIENVERVSKIKAFSESRMNSTTGKSERDRHQKLEQARQSLANSLGVVAVPVGGIENNTTYSQWQKEALASTLGSYTQVNEQFNRNLSTYGFSLDPKDPHRIINRKDGSLVSQDTHPQLYNELAARTNLWRGFETLKKEDDELNLRALRAAKAKAVELGMSAEDVYLDNGVLKVKGAIETSISNNNRNAQINDSLPKFTKHTEIFSAFNTTRNRETDAMVDSRPLQLVGYAINTVKTDGSGGNDNVNIALLETINTSLGNFDIATRYASGGNQAVTINENGNPVVGSNEIKVEGLKFEAAGFTISSEDGKPMVFGRMVDGKGVTVEGLSSVTLKGETVQNYVQNRLGDDYVMLKQAENFVSFVQSRVPRIGDRQSGMMTASELDLLGLNIVPTSDGYEQGNLESIMVSNIAGRQNYTVKFKGSEETVTYEATSPIDFLTNHLPKIQNRMIEEYEADTQRKIEGSVDFSQGQASTALENTDPRIKDYLMRTIQVESSGNDNARASTSSATGAFQFIKSTWMDYMEEFPELTAGKTRQQILDLRTDREVATKVAIKFTEDNAKTLVRNNVEIRNDTLYAAHFLGPQTAVNVLRAPDNTPIANVIPTSSYNANRSVFGPMQTVADFKAWLKRKHPN